MTWRVHNFNPGPAALPLPVLEQVQSDLLDFAGTGMSILEMSHRSATYEQLHNQVIADLRTLLGGTEDHAILFMGGGAQMQFALVALNLLSPGSYAEYLVTGVWSETALSEARKIGDARVLWSSALTAHTRIPLPGEFHIEAGAAYLHYTSNNTIVGTQYTYVPAARDVPLVCDMSSDLLSRPVDLSHYSLIYAGAQKNLGPAGVTVVLIRRDLLERCRPDLPSTRRMRHELLPSSMMSPALLSTAKSSSSVPTTIPSGSATTVNRAVSGMAPPLVMAASRLPRRGRSFRFTRSRWM